MGTYPHNTYRRSGFTIVELLVVIVVIAILAAITSVAYGGIQQRARDSQRVSDTSLLTKALEIYRADTGGYPICTSANRYVPGGATSASTVTNCLATALVPKYISKLPSDPQNTGSFQYFYGVGYRKTGTITYVADQTDNYILGYSRETQAGSTYAGWGFTPNVLLGSSN